ncbi:MAG: glycosyltransferase family protein [Anaerolineae bacterium]|nr:acylneuraminate cytidylyltransferase [Chloroflexota bacterium]MBV6435330.1 3-deoxy-manno-octulosonate cytidylyltransferase [Anaerolineae bacterium]MDL1917040.1 acylneuraminate cytidylyltransferase [Anaerolineae bacterium CFX4]MCO6445882.1 glycosyltransferase family protein [Anaerolineae bacterium]NOG50958.1 glycosyltransferase family protein [Chloroflexota bacterium]
MSQANTVCIIQARMGSTRLPGKIALPLLGKPMLWWVVHRVTKSRLVDAVVVATTTNPQDDPTAAMCNDFGWPCFRGSEEDVLDRYYQAAREFGAAHIVRITSDCPLIDPSVIDLVVAAYRSTAPMVDYASNTQQRCYPRGLDTEVFGAAALERAWIEDQSAWREHVTPYFYRHPEWFRLASVSNPTDYSHHRWTVDTPEDFELIERIYSHFGHGDFGWRDVLTLLDKHPEWIALNQHIEQKRI